jgi:hypothetical protein
MDKLKSVIYLGIYNTYMNYISDIKTYIEGKERVEEYPVYTNI